ncbi:MAG: hypothetical protein AAF291_01760 [Pseudomonadota bacterium]
MQARMPYIDRVWRVTSSIELEAPLSAQEVFARLRPLFDTQGSDYAIEGNTLTYAKTNPAAQDKLATFTSGTLNVENAQNGAPRLAYDVGSTALFLCFLAPLAFLAFGQFASFLNEIERPAFLAEQEEREAEKEAEAEETIELHWIDEMLGAPPPKQPGKEDSEARSERGRDGEKDEEEGYHSPTTAYAFAGIFFAIYLVGRVLEPYLLKRTFRAALGGPEGADPSQFHTDEEAVAQFAPAIKGDHQS